MNHKEKTKKTVSFNEPKRSAQSISRAKNEWDVWYFEEKSEVFITHQADSNQFSLSIGRLQPNIDCFCLNTIVIEHFIIQKYVYWTLVGMTNEIPFA